MVYWIYPAKLKLNKANYSDTEAPFFIWIYLFLMAQFPPRFMINGTILILILFISHFLMEMSLDVHHMAFTYLSLFLSLEHHLTWATSIVGSKSSLPSSLSRAVVIISYVRLFLSFIADTVSWLKNIMLAWGNFCTRHIGTRILWWLILQNKKNCGVI